MKSMPSHKQIDQLHRKYAPNPEMLELVTTHCKIVAEIALWCADNIKQTVDKELLETAALLHDIGSYPFIADAKTDFYPQLYPLHAIVGAKIVADEGISSRVADLIETHVLLGLSKTEIIQGNWHVPARDYQPKSIEGKLLCYADRFHSKQPIFNSYQYFLERLAKNLPKQAEKFQTWSNEFGIPDVNKLSVKYNHPTR